MNVTSTFSFPQNIIIFIIQGKLNMMCSRIKYEEDIFFQTCWCLGSMHNRKQIYYYIWLVYLQVLDMLPSKYIKVFGHSSLPLLINSEINKLQWYNIKIVEKICFIVKIKIISSGPMCHWSGFSVFYHAYL